MTTGLLFISHSAELNGAERMLLSLIQNLDRRRFTPHLALPEDGPLRDGAEAVGCAVITAPMKWSLTVPGDVWKQPLSALWNRAAVRRIAEYAVDRDCRLIYSNTAATFCGALAAQRLSLPHVWAVHEIISGPDAHLVSLRGAARLTEWMGERSCAVIANSETTARSFAGRPNIHIIPNGFEFSEPDQGAAAVFRKNAGAEPDDFLLGVVGKLYAGKGQMEIVRALPFLVEVFPRIKLVLIGGGGDARYERRIRRFRRENRLEDRLVLSGYAEDLTSALHALDCLVIPSTVESFGRVAVEAMAVHIPVLAVARGGLKEIIEQGRTGFLLDDVEPGTLVKAVRLVKEETDFVRRVTDAASLLVRERFSLERHVSSVEKVITTCLEGS